MENTIKIRGAKQHNLKNVDVDIPKNKLVVLTGLSGSGKSSLAFDTLYAEGQRRYVESLSTYARQFLGVMEKPDVDYIEGLSPAISIDQKTTSRNPRSTVGTVTEIYDYLRLLFAKIGHPHCPVCGREIAQQSVDQIVEEALALIKSTVINEKRGWFLVFSPVVRDRKGEYSSLFDNLKAKGYRRVRVDGYIKDLSDDFILIKTNKHSIDVQVDKLSLTDKNLKDQKYVEDLRKRLSDSIQQALNLSEGNVIFAKIDDQGFVMPEVPKKFQDTLFSERFACPVDNIQISEIEPRSFSFNSPQGACPTCTGLGKILKVEPALIFNDNLTIREGGITPFAAMFENDTWYSRIIIGVCEANGIDSRKPLSEITDKEKQLLLYGTGDRVYKIEGTNKSGKMTNIWEEYHGIVDELEKKYQQTDSDWVRKEIEKYMREQVCEECNGARLKQEVLSVTIAGLSISEVTNFSISDAITWIKELAENEQILNSREKRIGNLIIKEISDRLGFLSSVGLEYLTLSREAGTLSGGEAQRIRLASQIGSGLTGVLYVLDEPTIGLHQKDNRKLIDTLKRLRDLGNTVVVVEHDKEMIESADYVIDFGPGAGKLGGKVVASGTPKEIETDENSLTGKYLSGKRDIDIKRNSLINLNSNSLTIKGCSQFNLKNVDVTFPLGKLIALTGLSGSGKSTLLVETMYPALMNEINPLYKHETGAYKNLEGIENIDKVILIDQSPIGRTPRSNPATYTGVFDPIRDVFSNTHEAKALGFKKSRFSFNLKGGRCEACEGQGQTKIEMQFMSDIWVPCEVCKGKRYNAQTLDVTYKGKDISEVLGMTVSEAKEYFVNNPHIIDKLETLEQVGLGYIELGQPATTLSGGEAQRVKLASELSRKATGKTVYILDEPTTGLHFADVDRLLKVLRILVDKGNTVILIEHNLDVIKNADYIIDLGPEGGDKGGKIVASGKVDDIKRAKESYTGFYLKSL